MPEVSELYEAHVRFEIEAHSGQGLRESVDTEMAAIYEWLERIEIEDVVSIDDVSRIVHDRLLESELDEHAVQTLTDALLSIRETTKTDGTRFSELVAKESYDEVVDMVVEMEDLKAAIIQQITTSEAYSELIAHVLYRGIKNYAVEDGGIARRVPGAGSMMKLGRAALSSAAPDLEKGLDAQLLAFVHANISDSIRESRHYLEDALDADLMHKVADEFWTVNSDATVGEAVTMIRPEAVEKGVAFASQTWDNLRHNPVVQDAATTVITGFIESRRGRSIAEQLREVGLDQERAADLFHTAVAPFFQRAYEDGFLEERVRARLSSFYDQYL